MVYISAQHGIQSKRGQRGRIDRPFQITFNQRGAPFNQDQDMASLPSKDTTAGNNPSNEKTKT